MGQITYFCLAGYIVEREEYIKKIIPAVTNLKRDTFGKTDIIFHETEIRKLQGGFSCLGDSAKREGFWAELNRIFTDSDVKVIGVGVSRKIFETLYNFRNVNNEYNTALQVVLENYVHFLESRNAKGSVAVESTNETHDSRLSNVYHTIVSTGTLFLDKNAYQKRLTTSIKFYIKQDNNIGLQLADLIPNALNRDINGLPPKQPSLLGVINSKLYDGGVGNKERFGFKIIE